MGYRFRLHRRDLPGAPDIVFPKLRKIVFVHGCFWHLHNCDRGKLRPATNSEFWRNKRLKNAERDRKNITVLEKEGWQILVIWECWTRTPGELETMLANSLEERRGIKAAPNKSG
jgi:DNA mismatch endonuclease (patch repair protein)